MIDRSLPAPLELAGMQMGPLRHKSRRSTRQGPVQNLSVEGYPRLVARVADVEVRGIMVPEEHQNADSIKLADSRHRSNVRISCDMFDITDRRPMIRLVDGSPTTPIPGARSAACCVPKYAT